MTSHGYHFKDIKCYEASSQRGLITARVWRARVRTTSNKNKGKPQTPITWANA